MLPDEKLLPGDLVTDPFLEDEDEDGQASTTVFVVLHIIDRLRITLLDPKGWVAEAYGPCFKKVT